MEHLQRLSADDDVLTTQMVHADALDTAWVILTSIFIFLMQLGFAMLEAGSVRENSVIGTYMKNLLDLSLGTLASAFFGFFIAYGNFPITITVEESTEYHRKFFSYIAFQSTAATIVSGGMAERTSIYGYCLISFVMSGVVYALAVKFAWDDHGFLKVMGFHDFAGSGVIHVIGGTAALAGAWVVGPRRGRWDEGKESNFAPHSVPSVLSGALVLWVGWYGFNCGSTGSMATYKEAQKASHAALTTTLAACGGAVTAL